MSQFEEALRRQASFADVLREAEARGNGHVAAQARRLLADADAAVEQAAASAAEDEQTAEAMEFLREFGIELSEQDRPTGAENLRRYAATGDLHALAEALSAPAGEQQVEVAEALAEAAR